MLVNTKIASVQELLREGSRLHGGLFESKVSRKMGLSRNVVRRIVEGKFDHLLDPQVPKQASDRSGQFHKHREGASRCPGCGGLIHGECTLCILRAAIARGGKHTNVEIPAAIEIAAVRHALHLADNEAVTNQRGLSLQEARYTLTADGMAAAEKGGEPCLTR